MGRKLNVPALNAGSVSVLTRAWIKCRERIKERNQTPGTSSISSADFSKDGLSAVLSRGAALSALLQGEAGLCTQAHGPEPRYCP